MNNTSINFYDIFEKLETVGLVLAQRISQSTVLKDFAYIIFIWGLFEVFFRVYEKRDFMPFIHYIAYFAIMMAIFLNLNSASSSYSYIAFPAQVADGFTNGIIGVVSQQNALSAVNGALSQLDTQLVKNGPGNKMMPNANTPQQYKDLYALANQNLQQIGANCQLQDQMPIINKSDLSSSSSSLTTQEYTSLNGQPQTVTCQNAINNARSEINDYVNNYWVNTPTGKAIWIPNGDASANLNGEDYNTALFLGGGNISNIALGTIISNTSTDGISSKNDKGGLSFSVNYIMNYFLNSLGTLSIEIVRLGTQIMAPLMMYAMFMFNALFYSIILIMTPIVFVLAMQKPENITIYIKWIFTIIWARSWEIVSFLLVNIYNPMNISQGAGGVGVLGSSWILNDLWTITIITMVAISPGVMALVLLEGRAMITSAMVGIAGGLNIEHSVEKIGSVLEKTASFSKGGGGKGPINTGGGNAGTGGSQAMNSGPTNTGGGK